MRVRVTSSPLEIQRDLKVFLRFSCASIQAGHSPPSRTLSVHAKVAARRSPPSQAPAKQRAASGDIGDADSRGKLSKSCCRPRLFRCRYRSTRSRTSAATRASLQAEADLALPCAHEGGRRHCDQVATSRAAAYSGMTSISSPWSPSEIAQSGALTMAATRPVTRDPCAADRKGRSSHFVGSALSSGTSCRSAVCRCSPCSIVHARS